MTSLVPDLAVIIIDDKSLSERYEHSIKRREGFDHSWKAADGAVDDSALARIGVTGVGRCRKVKEEAASSLSFMTR